ncbi:hypothetical protein [Ensifer oleiphilus]|nr:hypothetical protein [Ensifer oleiphilus]
MHLKLARSSCHQALRSAPFFSHRAAFAKVKCTRLWKNSRSFPISEKSSQPALMLEDQRQMDRYFRDLAIDEDQLKMLQRVFRHACSSNDLELESDEADTLGASLIQIYQRGVRSELALMQMLGGDERRVAVNAQDDAPS